MGLDLSKDYLLIDDPVTVEYAVKTTENTWGDPQEVDYCQRNALTKDDIKVAQVDFPHLLQKDMTVFHLWRDNLGEIVPKIGDKLTHDSKLWVVQSVMEMDRDGCGAQRYRVMALKSTGKQTL